MFFPKCDMLLSRLKGKANDDASQRPSGGGAKLVH